MPRISSFNIPVTQNVGLYRTLVERHGQRVMWYMGSKCWCITDFAKPDPNCTNCFGRGDVYRPVTTVRMQAEAVGQGNRTIVANPRWNIKQVNRIFSVADEWTVTGVNANRIVVDRPVEKARVITVDFDYDLTSQWTGKAIAEGNGVLRVDITEEVEQGVFTGLIVSISSLTNNTAPGRGDPSDQISFVRDMWENRILIDITTEGQETLVVPGDDIDVTLTWVHPLKMVLSQIDPKTAHKNPTVLQQYHAQLITQGTYHIGEGDIITPQIMRQRDSVIGIYKSGQTEYRLPCFHVERLLRIEWAGGVINDATLVKKNVIQWGPTTPSPGSKFAVQFIYHPTFKVFNDLPNLRYAEDKEFPQKLFLKRFDAFNAQQERPSARAYQPGN